LLAACVPHLKTDGGGALGGGGFEEGDAPPAFSLLDQYGEAHELAAYAGSVVLLDVSTMWCAPCQELAKTTQATADAYRERGFLYLTVLQQDVEGGPVELADQQEWADAFAIVEPILDDSADPPALDGVIGDAGYPVVLVVDREGIIGRRVDAPVEETVLEAIEDVL
jgi:thiol-disulfide isomerase/thioredoxin